MIYQNFSKRQLLTLTWWNKPQFMDCDGIICDGSIRSGKTVSMTDGFILCGDRQSTLLRTVSKMFRTDCAKVDNEAGRSQRLE